MSVSESTLLGGADEAEFSFRPWIVCFTAALFFFYEFIQMHMFSSISPELMRDFSLNAEQLGFLSASYLYADVVFLLPAGMILDRISTRTVIIAAMAICITGTLGFALATNVWAAAFFHFLSGIGNAFCFLSCIMLASRWFPPRRQALVIGLIVTMAFIGGALAQTPLSLLAHAVGWRHALLMFGILIPLLGEELRRSCSGSECCQRLRLSGARFQ